MVPADKMGRMESAIRAVQSSDIETLLPLMSAYRASEGLVGFDEGKIHRQLQDFLSTPAFGLAWLMHHDNVPSGYLICTFLYSFEHGGLTAEIDELYVVPDRRGQGIGGALIDAARGELTARKCVALQMQVADGNARAQRFYGQLGFVEKAGYRLWLAPLPGTGHLTSPQV